ncbi:MAG: hypothetical protein HRU13_04845 [Phycisphaerales bacterium]|nr:hypothetical protein [Phycisphaerales bacterium]
MVEIEGDGSEWEVVGDITVGREGEARLEIIDGARLITQDVARLAWFPQTNARVLIKGLDSSWAARDWIEVGHGTAEVIVEDGGRLAAILSEPLGREFETDTHASVNVRGSGSTLNGLWLSNATILLENQGRIEGQTCGVRRNASLVVDGSGSLVDVEGAIATDGATMSVVGGASFQASASLSSEFVSEIRVDGDRSSMSTSDLVASSGGSFLVTGGATLLCDSGTVDRGSEVWVAGANSTLQCAGLARFWIRDEGGLMVHDGARFELVGTEPLRLGDEALLDVRGGAIVEVRGALFADDLIDARVGVELSSLDVAPIRVGSMEFEGPGVPALDVVLADGLAIAPGQQVPIVSSDGAVERFENFAEGDFVTSKGGVDLFISYVGGDGNDIVLNAVSASPCPADLDGDGALTLFDFLAFQNAFDAGCP